MDRVMENMVEKIACDRKKYFTKQVFYAFFVETLK